MNKIYYKVQFFCDTSLSWKDIQRKCPTIEEANITIKHSGKAQCRIMKVDGKKREVVNMQG